MIRYNLKKVTGVNRVWMQPALVKNDIAKSNYCHFHVSVVLVVVVVLAMLLWYI